MELADAPDSHVQHRSDIRLVGLARSDRCDLRVRKQDWYAMSRILIGMFQQLAFSQLYQNILRLWSCEPPAASCICVPSALR